MALKLPEQSEFLYQGILGKSCRRTPNRITSQP